MARLNRKLVSRRQARACELRIRTPREEKKSKRTQSGLYEIEGSSASIGSRTWTNANSHKLEVEHITRDRLAIASDPECKEYSGHDGTCLLGVS